MLSFWNPLCTETILITASIMAGSSTLSAVLYMDDPNPSAIAVEQTVTETRIVTEGPDNLMPFSVLSIHNVFGNDIPIEVRVLP